MFLIMKAVECELALEVIALYPMVVFPFWANFAGISFALLIWVCIAVSDQACSFMYQLPV